jgi:hypothetical protein
MGAKSNHRRIRGRLGTLAALGLLLALALPASALACPNEAFRTSRSAGLPDCRAYELITPANLGRAEDMTFTGLDHVIASSDGEHLALETASPLEPDPETSPDVVGSQAVFSRTATGWVMRSVTPPSHGAAGAHSQMRLFSPDLSQIAFESFVPLDEQEANNPPTTLDMGPVGGPYTTLVSLEHKFENGRSTDLLGANTGAPGVPAFSVVVFVSANHGLLPAGPERSAADEAQLGEGVVYQWSEGRLRLVNVEAEGSHIKLVSPCEAVLGEGVPSEGSGAVGAVSPDGSKIFFTTRASGAGCVAPGSLYMRVDGRETVEVARPDAGVDLSPSERFPVRYNVASQDGTEVFFNTVTPLTAAETPEEKSANKLFMYNTVTRVLTLVASGVPTSEGPKGRDVILSADGSTVYYEGARGLYRYAVGDGATSFVAAAPVPAQTVGEPAYTTRDGRFLVFPAGPGGVYSEGPHGLELETRGMGGNNELYRYDAADGSVSCVSCGEGLVAPIGDVLEPQTAGGRESVQGNIPTEVPGFIQMANGGGRVFFETTAQLAPQDHNSTEANIINLQGTPGVDVYEWEAPGEETAPGVFCRVAVGCTFLISTGEDVGPSHFLGASSDGRDLFFESAAQLTADATPEFSNIYDARVDGGFASAEPPVECLSCQGVGAPAPGFGVGASGSFVGAGNPAVAPPAMGPKRLAVKRPVRCRRGFVRRHGRCVRVRRGRAGKASRGVVR